MEAVLFFLLVPTLFCITAYVLNKSLTKRTGGMRSYGLACINYECGSERNETPFHKHYASFYLLATLFLLFELEVIFLIPFVTLFRPSAASDETLLIRNFLFIEVCIFILVLLLGLIYVLKARLLFKNKANS